MILATAIVAGLVAGWVSGGRLRELSRLRLRWGWLAVAALVVQSLVPAIFAGHGHDSVVVWAWIVLAAIASGVCIANWRTCGMLMIAAGLVLNLTVIAANGGMPVEPQAIARLGADAQGSSVARLSGFYHLATEATRLSLLDDAIPIAWPASARVILSIGDVALLGGLALVVACGMHGKTEA